MNRRTNGGLREGTEDTSDPSLDAGWDEVPESRAVPITAATHTLPPVTIAPRPRPSTRVPAPVSLGPLSMRGRNAGGGMGPTAVGSLGSSDDPSVEISFQFLDEALFELVEGSGPSEDTDAETSEPVR